MEQSPKRWKDSLWDALRLIDEHILAGNQALSLQQERIMAELTGLSAQVAELKSAQAEVAADIDAEIAQLQAALDGMSSSPTQAEIDAVTAEVKSVVDSLKASSGKLKGDDAPAPTPPAP